MERNRDDQPGTSKELSQRGKKVTFYEQSHRSDRHKLPSDFDQVDEEETILQEERTLVPNQEHFKNKTMVEDWLKTKTYQPRSSQEEASSILEPLIITSTPMNSQEKAQALRLAKSKKSTEMAQPQTQSLRRSERILNKKSNQPKIDEEKSNMKSEKRTDLEGNKKPKGRPRKIDFARNSSTQIETVQPSTSKSAGYTNEATSTKKRSISKREASTGTSSRQQDQEDDQEPEQKRGRGRPPKHKK